MSVVRDKTGIVHEFTEESIPKDLLLFSLPFILSNGLQVLYSLTDMVIVGRFVNSFGISAVSVSGQLCNLITVFGMGFSYAAQVNLAKLVGARRRAEIPDMILLAFLSMSLLGLALGAALSCGGKEILLLLRTPPEAFEMARQYVTVCGCGMVFSFLYNMASAVFRGMGDSAHPLLFILLASGLNILLDLLFVGVMKGGVAGAALATVISQALSAVASFAYLLKRERAFRFSFAGVRRLPRERVFSFAALGLSFAIQHCAVNVSMLFVSRMVNSAGVYASAVFGIGIRLDDIGSKASQGIQTALSTVVGQNIAAGKSDRVRSAVRCCWLYSAAISAVYVSAILLLNRQMFALFSADEAVLALAPVFASAIVWQFPAETVMRGTNGLIRGIGNGRLILIFGLLDAFVFRMGLCCLLGIVCDLGLFGFFLGYALGMYGMAIPGLVYYLSGAWERYGPAGRKA